MNGGSHSCWYFVIPMQHIAWPHSGHDSCHSQPETFFFLSLHFPSPWSPDSSELQRISTVSHNTGPEGLSWNQRMASSCWSNSSCGTSAKGSIFQRQIIHAIGMFRMLRMLGMIREVETTMRWFRSGVFGMWMHDVYGVISVIQSTSPNKEGESKASMIRRVEPTWSPTHKWHQCDVWICWEA